MFKQTCDAAEPVPVAVQCQGKRGGSQSRLAGICGRLALAVGSNVGRLALAVGSHLWTDLIAEDNS